MHNIPSFHPKFGEEYLRSTGIADNRPQWVIDLMPVNGVELEKMKAVEVLIISIPIYVPSLAPALLCFMSLLARLKVTGKSSRVCGRGIGGTSSESPQ